MSSSQRSPPHATSASTSSSPQATMSPSTPTCTPQTLFPLDPAEESRFGELQSLNVGWARRNEETRGLMNAETFGKMKKGAYFVSSCAQVSSLLSRACRCQTLFLPCPTAGCSVLVCADQRGAGRAA